MSNFTRRILILLLVSLPILSIIFYGLLRNYSKSKDDKDASQIPRLEWQQLRELDVKTAIAPPQLAQYNGKRVRVPGFVVPLEDNATQTSEFLLVPNPQACIHVPAPPPNQMVHVRMVGDKTHKISYGPIWVDGVLRIMETENVYGKVSYFMTAESTERYSEP